MIDAREFRLGREEPGALARGWHALPVWLQLMIVYFATRILTTATMLVFAANQEETWQTPARPDYWTFANIWDAEWYRYISLAGYPSELPMREDGTAGESAWAFMPVYPLMARGLSMMTFLPFEVVTVLLSLGAGLGTVLATHRLLRRFVPHGVAMFAVLLLCLGPISPMFQVGYAEALHFWMLALLLNLLVDRRWLAMIPLVILASLTRPTGLAWAFTLLLYILYRYRNRFVTRLERFDAAEQRRLWGVAVLSGVMGLAWLAIAGAVTGQWDAYLETEFAWRRQYTGGESPPPFTPWFWAGGFWFGQPAGAVIAAAAVLLFALWFTRPVMRRFGIEITLWGAAYTSYVLAVFFPQSSFFRILFPLFPAAAPLALPRSPLYRVLVALAAFALQVAWLHWMWFVIGHDWTPP